MTETAEHNFQRHIVHNRYPGRGFVIGLATAGNAWLQIYWIMGRSAHSQNRRFVVEGSTLRTEPVDASKVRDPSLIIYEAMLELPGIYLLSNGDQTRTLYHYLRDGNLFDQALATFNGLVVQYPNSPKAADSRLKTGYIYYEKKDWKQARQSLEAVVSEYPGSTAARLAGDRLKKMKSEGH